MVKPPAPTWWASGARSPARSRPSGAVLRQVEGDHDRRGRTPRAEIAFICREDAGTGPRRGGPPGALGRGGDVRPGCDLPRARGGVVAIEGGSRHRVRLQV